MAISSSGGHFDTAQICVNGHVLESMLNTYPERSEKYCSLCSEPTITTCPKCNIPLRGVYHYEYGGLGDYKVPNYCYNCSKPYPWTKERLKIIMDMVSGYESLTTEVKEAFLSNIQELIRDTPRRELAAQKINALNKKRVMAFNLQWRY